MPFTASKEKKKKEKHGWEKNQVNLNIFYTRDEYFTPDLQSKLSGDFGRAMHRMGYKVKKFKLFVGVPDLFEFFNINTALLFSLSGTLEEGKVKQVPEIIKKQVDYIKRYFIKNQIDGVYIPPTPTSTFFDNMVKHLKADNLKSCDGKIEYPEMKMSDSLDFTKRIQSYNSLLLEVSAILAASKLEIPIFGSCHGAQLLWYMHGGEIYSLPDYSTTYRKGKFKQNTAISTRSNSFRVEDGCLINPNNLGSVYSTTRDTVYKEENEGYESDDQEEDQKDYSHNLLMASDSNTFTKLNAKLHPIQYDIGLFPPIKEEEANKYLGPKMPEGKLVAKSFTFPGCIGLQWHPHKNIDTKSSIHYLHMFGRMCLEYRGKSKEEEVQPAQTMGAF